jgi:hypothetical protein
MGEAGWNILNAGVLVHLLDEMLHEDPGSAREQTQYILPKSQFPTLRAETQNKDGLAEGTCPTSNV